MGRKVQNILKEALSETDFTIELVSDSNEIGIIQKRIVQNIYDNDIVICDVSAKNPNVMFELGMRLAFDKPAIIIKDDKTNYSFDTAPIEHLEYPRDLHYHSIQLFKSKLRDKVLATYEASKRNDYTTFLKNFGQFVVAKIEENKVGSDEYILAELLEMKDEIRLLVKQQSKAHEQNFDPYPPPKQNPANAWPFPTRRSEPLITEADYIIDLIEQGKISSKSKTNLLNENSKKFQEICDDYIKKFVPGTPSAIRLNRITKNIKSAIDSSL